jgi:hypothetical protein
MTRLISNMTRSSAVASLAGVGELLWLICVVTYGPFGAPLAGQSSPYGTPLYGGWVVDVLFPGSDDGALAGKDEPPRCSAKGCRAAAVVDLQWRNPRLHDAARVKHWLACDEHADSLAGYLSARQFLLGRRPIAEPGADQVSGRVAP